MLMDDFTIHGVIKTVFVIIGLLVAAELLYAVLFVGNGNGGAVVYADRAVESSMSNMYEKYVYDVNAYKYANFDGAYDKEDTVEDIFEAGGDVEWYQMP